MDIQKTIEQLRSECLVMEELGRQFVEKCQKTREALETMSALKTTKKEPALSNEQKVKLRANLRKSMLIKRPSRS